MSYKALVQACVGKGLTFPHQLRTRVRHRTNATSQNTCAPGAQSTQIPGWGSEKRTYDQR